MGHFAPAFVGSGRSFIMYSGFRISKSKMATGESCSRKSRKEVISKVKKSRPPTSIGVYEAERLIARRKSGQVKFSLRDYNYYMFCFMALYFEYTNRQSTLDPAFIFI